MNKIERFILKLLSSLNIDIKKDYPKIRNLQDFFAPRSRFIYELLDKEVLSSDLSYLISVRKFNSGSFDKGVIMYFHGGGWVIGDIDSYIPTCSALARETGRTVVSVAYRLAPEHPYPKGFEDCYEALDKLLEGELLEEYDRDDVVVMGDSAGANLATAVCLKRRDEGKKLPNKQVLIYPATYWDHSENSPFPSIVENGYGYGLTSERVEDYLSLYVPDINVRKTAYVAPLTAEDFSNLPDALIISAEYDPLRDEGEEYGRKLIEAGNNVKVVRIEKAVHGFFTYPLMHKNTREAYDEIVKFLKE